jgi:hypothetical protein
MRRIAKEMGENLTDDELQVACTSGLRGTSIVVRWISIQLRGKTCVHTSSYDTRSQTTRYDQRRSILSCPLSLFLSRGRP